MKINNLCALYRTITQGVLMAEELKCLQFSVHERRFVSYTRKKFNGPEGKKLGQLVVTPEVVACKINTNER